MSSHTAPSSTSPIATLPSDVLNEIFTQCLLMYPLHNRMRTRTAPIRLCHVCMSWRRVALASPTLWTHLAYSFPLLKKDELPHSSMLANPTSGLAFDFIECDIAFLRWCKWNQGQIAPFLSLSITWNKPIRPDLTRKARRRSERFFLEYLTSAQLLELDTFYWMWICNKIQAGYPVIFPNLHTILVDYRYEADLFRELQTLLPVHAFGFPALRRLSTTLQVTKNFVIPHVWSTLTHVSLKIFTSLEFEFSLSFIHFIPQLRWGHFDISVNSPFTISDHTPPLPHCTLLDLDTLSIAVHGGLDHNLRSPLT
ncbi:hypothetical protein BJ912DRAFT_1065092 [Pholiota molesta]|nr:hypothetical protein BJ912DRAFT_1065092 [Pholiota molesta]